MTGTVSMPFWDYCLGSKIRAWWVVTVNDPIQFLVVMHRLECVCVREREREREVTLGVKSAAKVERLGEERDRA